MPDLKRGDAYTEADKEELLSDRSRKHHCYCPRGVVATILHTYNANGNTTGNTQQDHVSHFLHFIVSCIAASTLHIQRILRPDLLAGYEGCTQQLQGHETAQTIVASTSNWSGPLHILISNTDFRLTSVERALHAMRSSSSLQGSLSEDCLMLSAIHANQHRWLQLQYQSHQYLRRRSI